MAYLADDDYYFDEEGTLHLLVQCSNTVYETDVNGDGEEVDFPVSGAGNSTAGALPEQIRAFQAEVRDLLKDAEPIVGYGAVTDPFSGEKGPICFAYLDETLH